VAAALVAGSRGDDLRQPPPSVASRAIRRNSLASLANSTSARPSARQGGQYDHRTGGADERSWTARPPARTYRAGAGTQSRSAAGFPRFPAVSHHPPAACRAGYLGCALRPRPWQDVEVCRAARGL